MNYSNLIRGAMGVAMGSLLSFGAFAQGNFQTNHTGKGTFYGYSGGGNCSVPFAGTTVLTAAMNAADYNNSQACGSYIEVTNLNTSQTVVVRIDDQCPGCGVGDVDLSEQAFGKISPMSAGIIPIRWKYVDGPSTPAKVYFKEGSSQWWAGVQVREHRNPIASVAYRRTGSGSAYANLPREAYNYFIASSGMGTGPYDLKITDVFGNVLDANSVALSITTEITTGKQFPKVLTTGVTGGSTSTSTSTGTTSGSTTGTTTGSTSGSTSTSTGTTSGSTSTSSGSTTTTTATLPATTSLSPINEWNSGYCTNVNVTNPNSLPLNWTISMTITGTVSSSWNANLTQTGNKLTGTGVDWNKTLAAGATTQFGYCANK